MAYTHSIFPGYVPAGFFDEENITFIREKVAHVLGLEFAQRVNVDRASVVRIMQRVLGERLEDIPRMNQRVIMYITNDVRNHQAELKKHMNWEEHYILSRQLYDPSAERTFDTMIVKLKNRFGLPRVGGTMRFTFI